jgi:flagellar motility protein MotE (MotC chaperone)
MARPPRLRLFDAVALAAGGLLVLKVVGLVLPSAADEDGSAFAQVIAHARTNYEPRDPLTTNSTGHGAPPKAAEPSEPTPAGAAANRIEPSAVPPSPTEKALLEKLGERRDAERQRDRGLDLREQILQDAERKLEGRIGDLKGLEEKADVNRVQRAEGDAGLKNIVTMYETMKPKDAARVFDRLTLDVLVPVVVQMNPRKMAEILGLMQSESAEKLTVALANRARGMSDAKSPVAEALPAGELPAIDPPGGRRPAPAR